MLSRRRGRDADIVRVHPRFARDARAARAGPVFHMRIPVIGEREREAAARFFDELRAGNQRRNAHGERERVDARILFPPVLVGARTVAGDETQCAAHHVPDFHGVQRAAFGERRRQQHRESRFVELHAVPERLAAEPLVLRPVPVFVLGRDQVAQDRARLVDFAQRQERARAFDQIARPHQVVAADIVAAVSPGNAETGDERAGIGLVVVHAQHHRGRRDLIAHGCGQIRGKMQPLLPCAPRFDMLLPRMGERRGERGEGERRRRFAAGAETERERRAAGQFADQRDVARAGAVELPGQRAVAGEVLPAVAGSDVTGARDAPRVALMVVDGGQRERERPLVRPQNFAPAITARFRRVVVAGAAEVGREQCVRAQVLVAVEAHLDQQHVALRIGRDPQPQIEARMLMDDFDRGNAGSRLHAAVTAQALHLHPEALAVGDDESEVADLRDVGARVIHLVQDAEARGEPEPRRAERAAHHVLRAAGPRGCNAGMAWSVHCFYFRFGGGVVMRER